jgi:phosphate transport system substrate-binding protein
MIHTTTRILATTAMATALLFTGCKKQGGGGAVIQNKGSDTLVNVAQSWAEEYKKINPAVDVEVSGGGSGVGIAALIKGTIDIANSSRDMKADEIEQAKKNTGKEPKKFIVGYDALAIYVHKDNPINEITTEQLDQVFAEGGTVTKWSQFGVTMPDGSDEIIRVSRQSSSGTYEFFREHEGSRRTRLLHARCARLQRHGLRDRPGEDAQGLVEAR